MCGDVCNFFRPGAVPHGCTAGEAVSLRGYVLSSRGEISDRSIQSLCYSVASSRIKVHVSEQCNQCAQIAYKLHITSWNARKESVTGKLMRGQ